jgi:hypothetical protein
MKILCCIFTWKGQFANAVRLQEQISPLMDVVVINSDDDNTKDGWIDIGNECYFSEQFKTALDLFDSSKYDVLWHVQADASFDDWSPIVESAKSSFELYNWGVFAPNVDDTFYIGSRVDIEPISNNLMFVANTDNTCWFVHKDFIDELKENIHLMDGNNLGWGWDLLICAFSLLDDRIIIRDYSFTVNHPLSTGYMKDQAEQEMVYMYNICPLNVQDKIYRIKTNHKSLTKNQYDIIYDTSIGCR